MTNNERIKELNILLAPLALAKVDLMQQVFEPNDELPLTYSYLSHLYDAYDELLGLAGLKKKDTTELSNTELEKNTEESEMTNDDAIVILTLVINLLQYEVNDNNNRIIEAVNLAIDNLKTTRPKGEWIPISERLPDRHYEVIVTDAETNETYVSQYLGNGYWECDNGTFRNRIIAWQPLPEPYKEAGQ